MSEETKADNSTLEEQRQWVGEQLEAAIAESGAESGWFRGRETAPWSALKSQRDSILDATLPRNCGIDSGGRLDISLINTSIEDPFESAAKVRTFWESQGWVVTDLWSEPSPDEKYFRADRPDGAELALQAKDGGISLEVSTACSLHSTVTNWEEYVDLPEDTPTMQPDT